MLYIILVLVNSKRDLGVFVRMGSLGSIFVCMFILGLCGLAAYSFVTTNYRIGTTEMNTDT